MWEGLLTLIHHGVGGGGANLIPIIAKIALKHLNFSLHPYLFVSVRLSYKNDEILFCVGRMNGDFTPVGLGLTYLIWRGEVPMCPDLPPVEDIILSTITYS